MSHVKSRYMFIKGPVLLENHLYHYQITNESLCFRLLSKLMRSRTCLVEQGETERVYVACKTLIPS